MIDEREMYLNRRKEEMEYDLKCTYERLESEHRQRMITHDNRTFKPENLVAKEVVAVLTIVVGAAWLLGLI